MYPMVLPTISPSNLEMSKGWGGLGKGAGRGMEEEVVTVTKVQLL
jgi:hypothetical protein